jgi:IPT/TIG domain
VATEQPITSDPVEQNGIIALGIYFFALAAVIFYFLVATWPVQDTDIKAASVFKSFSILWWGPFSPESDIRLFFTAIAAGAVGSLIHSLTSFGDYVGNRRLARSWVWWFILRTPVGIALALLFYLVLRGGLIVPSMPVASAGNGPSTIDTTRLLNPYGIAAIAAMAGMFSKQATDKLREIFDTLFRTRDPVDRADPLRLAAPVISGTTPARLKVRGPAELRIAGRGFQPNCIVSINGKRRTVQQVTATQITVTVDAEDIAAEGRLELVVENPGPNGGKSASYPVPVDAA